jgi:hypothetical protein
VKDHKHNDPLPTTREEVLEEINYWQQRVGRGQPGSPLEEQVKQRLESLYALLQHYSSPPLQKQSRPVLVLRELIKAIPYFGKAIDTAIFEKF